MAATSAKNTVDALYTPAWGAAKFAGGV